MPKKTKGIHHITAIVGHPQENVDFYAGVLALRLVKKTVNFDDPATYHLYFGDEGGNPGTIMTFFPWPNARRGKIGAGQVGVTAFAVPQGALAFWEKRLEAFNIAFSKVVRFGELYLQFEDPHGLQLELVEREGGASNTWQFGDVTPEVAIKGFAGATLLSKQPERTAELLECEMGLEKAAEEGEFIRFRSTAEIGNIIDLRKSVAPVGQIGVGMVHHIAWRAVNDEDQYEWKKQLERAGYRVTPVRDRHYFNAIYFKEYGGILFEMATDPPGFAHDESFETMGEKLMLPAQYEPDREKIEQTVLPFNVRQVDFIFRKD
ncbi:ring-cleaving dioxygenase [Alkalihalobacillus oceani]|uniref:Ring-cleaving dioxygenase n=1 Tax=Halalkalibacter oceani TaxID=1653776 RepID=A0A9X2DVZ4_9BACI|nr:ring-cleaving dioxygenase [Halalkalibacter oceani]MCM3716547.1 ring-cleaving dioxygenase [Halalkalibacter oceani]